MEKKVIEGWINRQDVAGRRSWLDEEIQGLFYQKKKDLQMEIGTLGWVYEPVNIRITIEEIADENS